MASVGLDPARSQVDLSNQWQDIPEVTGLKAVDLHHLQQQIRRALGQGFCCIQKDFIVDYTTETDSSGGEVAFHFSQVELAQIPERTESSIPGLVG